MVRPRHISMIQVVLHYDMKISISFLRLLLLRFLQITRQVNTNSAILVQSLFIVAVRSKTMAVLNRLIDIDHSKIYAIVIIFEAENSSTRYYYCHTNDK